MKAADAVALSPTELMNARFRKLVIPSLFVVLTGCGWTIFALTITFTPTFPQWADYLIRAVLLVTFGALWWRGRRSAALDLFQPLFFAAFTVVLAISLGHWWGSWALHLLHPRANTIAWITITKLSETSLTLFGILALLKLTRLNMASVYLSRGRWQLSLIVGSLAAAGLTCWLLRLPQVRGITTGHILALLPWALAFVLPNALMEELLFRGLFLRPSEALIGKWPSVVSTSLVFAFAHIRVTYAPDMPAFLITLLILALAWATLSQITRSIWGSVVFHAAATMFIVVPMFAQMPLK